MGNRCAGDRGPGSDALDRRGKQAPLPARPVPSVRDWQDRENPIPPVCGGIGGMGIRRRAAGRVAGQEIWQ